LYNRSQAGEHDKDTMTRLGLEEAAMNDKTGGNRGPRRAGALAVVAAAAALATACSGGSDPSSASSPTFAQEVALAQCMRSHGVPNFPDPNPSGGFSLHETIDGQILAAYGACRHLLPGGPSLAEVQRLAQQEQQKQEQALPELVKFSQCVRSHGVPNFPDPPANGQGAAPAPGASIDPNSPRFLAAVRICQHVLPPGAHVTIGMHASVGTNG
jgi:hypothetical protein